MKKPNKLLNIFIAFAIISSSLAVILFLTVSKQIENYILNISIQREEQSKEKANSSIICSLENENESPGSVMGKNCALTRKENDKKYVIANGIESNRYDDISNLFFSYEGRLVFVAEKEGKFSVILDNKESDWYDHISNIIFSNNGMRIAYIAKEKESYFVVLDKKRGRNYQGVYDLNFSPDSKHLGYIAYKYNNYYYTIIDGEETGIFNNVYSDISWRNRDKHYTAFSPDGKHIAYINREYNQSFIVLDGIKQEQKYDYIYSPIFSPDSKHFAYLAEKGNKYLIVSDNNEGKAYDFIDPSSFYPFSPDGKHIFYSAKNKGASFIIEDNKEMEISDNISFYNVIFSPDGKRIAHLISIERELLDMPSDEAAPFMESKSFYILDGKKSKEYDLVYFPKFSPDNKHFAFIAEKDNKKTVILDNEETEKYDYADSIIFSPDSKHFAYIAAKEGKNFIVLDGKKSKEYDYVYSNLINFTSDGKFIKYNAILGKNVYYIVEAIL